MRKVDFRHVIFAAGRQATHLASFSLYRLRLSTYPPYPFPSFFSTFFFFFFPFFGLFRSKEKKNLISVLYCVHHIRTYVDNLPLSLCVDEGSTFPTQTRQENGDEGAIHAGIRQTCMQATGGSVSSTYIQKIGTVHQGNNQERRGGTRGEGEGKLT